MNTNILAIQDDNCICHTKRTYISLFSSAGVGCYGFKQNDFECIATNEIKKERLLVQQANNKCKYPSGYICGDIKDSKIQKLLFDEIEVWRNFENLKQVDVVFATPPCQGMSTANYKKTGNEQVRNSLVVEAIKLIKEINPKVFILENVRAFMKTICTDIDGTDKTIQESIYNNLSKDYYIYHKVINFKDYGVPSSRPRTIVIGTNRTLKNITPLNLFPTRQNVITLREAIGNLPSLKFGAKDKTDFLHFARPFPEYQLAWISDLKEGQSAFDKPTEQQPFKVVDGEKVLLKGAYMGNKYRRLVWDKPCSCIATRNDQLASQDTIHPIDNRVLSIRELMILMTIPNDFKWTKNDNLITPKISDKYLKENELNIRRCIGEAVPTQIIKDISHKINVLLDFEDFVQDYNENLLDKYLQDDILNKNFYIKTYLEEKKISDAKESGSFYTPQAVVFDTIKDLKCPNDTVKILEPSVGLGAFLPQITALFSEKESIEIDAVEINQETINILKNELQTFTLGCNVTINYICSDFLSFQTNSKYDVVVTNPPYAKAINKYPQITEDKKVKNLFAFFLIKIFGLADEITCVIPKNFIMADEFANIRKMYEDYSVVSICDYGVKSFKNVFVEIASFHFSKNYDGSLTVIDYRDNQIYIHPQKYIFHDRLWVIYRNSFFDDFISKLQLDVFTSFRDRQITNSKTSDTGKIWVLRSKNILDNGEIVHKTGYDKYINDISTYSIGKYLNTDAILMVNFTYNIRAARLPENAIPNGSIAILTPRNSISNLNLDFYATPEFREYYAIVKSRSKFTLNIDESSCYYIGIKK